MIKKYENFIHEGLKMNLELLLEGFLSASSEFSDRIRSLRKESGAVGQIAKIIITFLESDCYVDDDDIKQNFLDITDKEDMVSFLMQSRIPDDWNEDQDPSLPFKTRGRGEIKVGKLIKYILELIAENDDPRADSFKQKDIEDFVNAYKATKVKTNWKFKLLDGKDIAKYYNGKKYFTGTGTLGGSCMKDEQKSFFKIYSDNSDKVGLLVLIDEEEDKICGRALIWKLKKSPCDAKYFMDRVYTNRDSDFWKFKKYAEDERFLYKAIMNSHLGTNVAFKYGGADVFGEINVKIDGDFEDYPFLDTLCFLNADKNLLSNVPFEEGFKLQSVYGECGVCEDCEGLAITQYGDGLRTKKASLCKHCAVGHEVLLSKGINTDLIRKVLKK